MHLGKAPHAWGVLDVVFGNFGLREEGLDDVLDLVQLGLEQMQYSRDLQLRGESS